MIDCYTCKHVGKVVGSAHSCCNHPNFTQSPVLVSRVLLTILAGATIGPWEFERHGIEMGWCNFPLDFDPMWLKRCDWREETQEEE